MKLSRRSWIIVGAGLLLVAGLTLSGFFTKGEGTSTASHSMSHNAANQMAGVLDPGDGLGVGPVSDVADVVPEVDAMKTGAPTVAGDLGDVITFNPDLSDHQVGIVHRAVAFVRYNATSDSYDVPSLHLVSVREFVTPPIGTYDEVSGRYMHVPFAVWLNPDTAGRHDGFLTKGDNNEVIDQDARAGSGSVHLDDKRAEEILSRHVELVDLAHVDGKVVHIRDKENASTTFFVAAGGAALLTIGAVVVMPRVKRSGLAGSRCATCGKRADSNLGFCAACGATR